MISGIWGIAWFNTTQAAPSIVSPTTQIIGNWNWIEGGTAYRLGEIPTKDVTKDLFTPSASIFSIDATKPLPKGIWVSPTYPCPSTCPSMGGTPPSTT